MARNKWRSKLKGIKVKKCKGLSLAEMQAKLSKMTPEERDRHRSAERSRKKRRENKTGEKPTTLDEKDSERELVSELKNAPKTEKSKLKSKADKPKKNKSKGQKKKITAKRRKPMPKPVEKISQGEAMVRSWLYTRNVPFEREVNFPDLLNPKTKMQLRFDFWLPDHQTVIEFDGKQHYEPAMYLYKTMGKARDELKKLQYRDKIKDEYCKDKNITMIRIKYNKIKEVFTILDLHFLKK